MRTDFCDLLGIEHPIVAAPMGPDLTGPEHDAAVAEVRDGRRAWGPVDA